jgi:hypothetical protein
VPIYRKINKDFFKKWTPEMAYILGFLFADGNITINSRGANYFAFYSIDKDVLQFIKQSMESSHKISKRNARSGNVYRLQVGSKDMIEDLFILGLVDTKAKRMKFPDIPNKYLNSFILGFFDGDGNVWMGEIHKKRKTPTTIIQSAFTSASVGFINGLYKKLKELGVRGGCIYSVSNKNCMRLTLSVKDSLKLYKIMYNEVYTPFCLKRKKRVFERFNSLRL